MLLAVGVSETAVEMPAVRSALGRVPSEPCALLGSASSPAWGGKPWLGVRLVRFLVTP